VGPTLIEAKTYRFRGHSRTDPATYRPEGELEAWLERDPIELLAAELIDERVLDADDVTALRGELQAHIDQAAEQAGQAPVASLEEVATYVYAS
jgi:pyruvate dehydrogenase E1 component alpha subunit